MLKHKVLNIFVVVGCWRSRPWLQNAQTKSLPRQALWYHDGLLEKGICRTTHIWNVTVAVGRFLPDRWKAVQGVGKIRVCNSNVVQSLIQNTTQNLDCWDLFRESMWNVLESDQFPFNHYHYFYFFALLSICCKQPNSFIHYLVRLEVLLAPRKTKDN